jgi:hypothetical protein
MALDGQPHLSVYLKPAHGLRCTVVVGDAGARGCNGPED